jgi:hypothetical protein
MKIAASAVLSLFLAAQNSAAPPPDVSAPPAAAAATTPPKIDPAKERDIRELLNVVGTAALVKQVMSNMEQDMKPLMTRALPPGDYREQLVDLFLQKFQTKINTDTLLNLAIARYNEDFSDDEIKQLISFYKTPVGQKVVVVLPKLTAELQQDGNRLGQQVGREAMIEVLAEHPDLAQALKEPAHNSAALPPSR